MSFCLFLLYLCLLYLYYLLDCPCNGDTMLRRVRNCRFIIIIIVHTFFWYNKYDDDDDDDDPVRCQTLASLPKIFEARPIRLSISGVERSDEWISLPRYMKRSVDSTMWPCNCTGAGVTPWPKLWILVFDQEVFRPIVCAALSKLDRMYTAT